MLLFSFGEIVAGVSRCVCAPMNYRCTRSIANILQDYIADSLFLSVEAVPIECTWDVERHRVLDVVQNHQFKPGIC